MKAKVHIQLQDGATRAILNKLMAGLHNARSEATARLRMVAVNRAYRIAKAEIAGIDKSFRRKDRAQEPEA